LILQDLEVDGDSLLDDLIVDLRYLAYVDTKRICFFKFGEELALHLLILFELAFLTEFDQLVV